MHLGPALDSMRKELKSDEVNEETFINICNLAFLTSFNVAKMFEVSSYLLERQTQNNKIL